MTPPPVPSFLTLVKFWADLTTQLGTVRLFASEQALLALIFDPPAPGASFPSPGSPSSHPIADILRRAERQLSEYFEGQRQTFDLPLAPQGTRFQQQVWNQLLRVPYGQTLSYGELAQRVGNPRASRAVGSANGKNPLPIIIPCHRIVGANGSLTGYSCGLPRKKYLLDLERACPRFPEL